MSTSSTVRGHTSSQIAWMQGVDVPDEWHRTKVKHLIKEARAGDAITSEQIEPHGEHPVYGGNGRRGYTDEFTHAGTYLLIGRQGALCGNVHLVSGTFWASEHAIVCEPRPDVVPRWLAYLLEVMDLGQYSVTAAQPGIGISQVVNIETYVPAPAEQWAIANFLDEQTSRIDTLIAKQDHLIDTLQERRRAVAEHAVWAGLRRSETLRSAQIGCAPSVPIHWDWTRNKNILVERDDLSFDGSEELLTVSHLTGITPRSEKKVTMIEAESHTGYRLVSSGDLVINTMWAWMGALGISRNVGMVSPAYGVYTFRDRNQTDPCFFDYLFRSRQYVTEMTRFSRGVWTSRLRLYPESFLQLPVVVPPIVEQREIVKYLDEQTSRIDALIAKTGEHIVLAKERRSALIAAAVTGQIDLRSAAQAGAE